MTVYIEYVLIDNFTIDFLVLKLSLKISGAKTSVKRLVICSLLGAIIALSYPLAEINPVLLVLLKVTTGILIVLISAKFKDFKNFYVSVILFFFLTFALGGSIVGIYSLFGLSYDTEVSVATVFLPAIALIYASEGIIGYLFKRKRQSEFIYRVKLIASGGKAVIQGFLDTGNLMYDGGDPMIIIDKKTAEKLIGIREKIHKVDYSVVSGKGEMTVFKINSMTIYLGEKENIFNNVSAGVADGKIASGFDALLHPAFFGEVENVFEKQIEKIS